MALIRFRDWRFKNESEFSVGSGQIPTTNPPRPQPKTPEEIEGAINNGPVEQRPGMFRQLAQTQNGKPNAMPQQLIPPQPGTNQQPVRSTIPTQPTQSATAPVTPVGHWTRDGKFVVD